MDSDLRKGAYRRTDRHAKRRLRRNLVEGVSVAGFIIFAIITVLAYMDGTTGYGKSLRHLVDVASHKNNSNPANSAQGSGLASHRVGSILLPANNSDCEERSFDNLTGRIVSEKLVNCEEAIVARERAQAGALQPEDRMRAITGAFKR
jgi:hypothetical protein